MTSTEAEALPEPEVPAVDDLVLAGEFPAASRAGWQKLVLGVVKKAGLVDAGASPEDGEAALESVMPDGFTVRGLYTSEPNEARDAVPVNARSGWDVRTRHTTNDAAQTNRTILDDLEGGASSVWLALGGNGLPVADLAKVLDGVYLDLAPVVLDAGGETSAAAATFLDLAADRGIADGELRGVLGADPIGLAARTGAEPDFSALTELATTCAERYPQVVASVVDGLPYADAGATDGQELGLSLATGVAYLRALTDAGLSVEAAAGAMEFRYSAGVDQFATIAKLRAARQLWSRVCEVSGAPGVAQRQHAVTSPTMYAGLDAHTNLIRATIATFAAGVGGADAVTVLPFDSAIGAPDDFSRRIARNTSALLIEESHVAAVADPAGGSWAVEALTAEFARAGWAVFQQVEAAGGMPAALSQGLVAELLQASTTARAARHDHGSEGIVGVTDFPDLAEAPPHEPPDVGSGGLPVERPAATFERLRVRSAAATANREQSVVLLLVGDPRSASRVAASVEKLLVPGGVRAGRATLDSPPELAGQVVVICPAPDADTTAANELAAGAALTLTADVAKRLGITELLIQVLSVLAPEEAG